MFRARLALILALAVLLPASSAAARRRGRPTELGPTRRVAAHTPVSVEFRVSMTGRPIPALAGTAAGPSPLPPRRVACGAEYEVEIVSDGGAGGVANVPVTDLRLEVTAEGGGTQRQNAVTDGQGRARVRFRAPDAPTVVTLRVVSPGPNFTAGVERTLGTYVYRLRWRESEYRPPTRRGRANYLDPVRVLARVVEVGVRPHGEAYEEVKIFPDDRLGSVRIQGSQNVRFTHGGQTADGRIVIPRSTDGGIFLEVRGQYSVRENLYAYPLPAADGVTFPGTFADPTWVEFIHPSEAYAQAIGFLLRPSGAARTTVREDEAADFHVDLGRHRVGRLYDPPRPLQVQAWIPTLAAPAVGVVGNARVTRGDVQMIATAGAQADSSGLLRVPDGRMPAWFKVNRVGENLVEVTADGSSNKVVYHLEGIAEPWMTVTDGGSVEMTLDAAANPSPVNMNRTDRSLVSGTFRYANAPPDANIVLRVMIERGSGEILMSDANRSGAVRENRDLDAFADIRPGADGSFSFHVRRTSPGRARVRIYAWTRRWDATMREVPLEIDFRHEAAPASRPAVRLGEDGVDIDIGGGTFRIPTRRRTGESSTGSGTATTGTAGGDHDGCPPGCTIQH